MQGKCSFCKVVHCAENFDRSKTPSNLSMLRIAVGRLEAELEKSDFVVTVGCDNHRSTDYISTFDRLQAWKIAVAKKQGVDAYIS